MSQAQVAPRVPALQEQQTMSNPASSPSSSYSLAVGYLRAFVTVLVVSYHSVLAYFPFVPAPAISITAVPWLWLAFPVLDPQRWVGFALYAGFNDTFFMSLMFFLSGLFVWPSLRRKGAAGFLRDRVFRLGLPFAFAAAFIAPVAYFPAYLQAGHHDLIGFWHQWRSLGSWPTGPAWFIWLLLAFDCVAAALCLRMPRWGESLGRVLADASRRPAVFFVLLVIVSSLVYVSMARLSTPPLDWVAFGPFAFEISRILHYFVYFLIAVGIGAYGVESGLLASGGKLGRRWPVWVGAAILFFFAVIVIASKSDTVTLATPPPNSSSTVKSPSHVWETMASFAFTFSCAASCFAFLALFIRFARKANGIGNSLRDNAYGIYLIHYAFVIWIQYALLKAQLPAPAKGLIVFLCALGLSWGASAVLRRIPAVARVV